MKKNYQIHLFVDKNLFELLKKEANVEGLSVSELCLVGKPVIFIPSPNVAEDHQTKNAQALVERNAALLLKDNKAVQELGSQTLALLADEEKRRFLEKNIADMAQPEAAKKIANEVIKLVA